MLKKTKVGSNIAFIEPLLTSSMVLERHMDICIKEYTPYGLSQFKILLSVQRAEGWKKKDVCCQSLIAQLWGVSEAAISRQVSLMIKDRLMTKVPDPNEKRRVILKLTAKGKTFVSKTLRMIDKELNRLFKSIAKSTKVQLAKDLHKVLKSLSQNTNHYEITDINKA